MLKIELNCETLEEARIYINAHNYLNLIFDTYNSIKQARKHGDASDMERVLDTFLPEMAKAIEHDQGAY